MLEKYTLFQRSQNDGENLMEEFKIISWIYSTRQNDIKKAINAKNTEKHKATNIDSIIREVIKYVHNLFNSCEIQVSLYTR